METFKKWALISSYAICLFTAFILVFFENSHFPATGLLILICFVSTLIFLGIALYEIFNSNGVRTSEKIIWIVGIIFLSAIAGLFYILTGRQRMLARKDV